MMKPDAAGGCASAEGWVIMLSDSICASCTGTRRAAFRKHSRNLCHTGDLFLQTVDCQVVGHCACPTPNGQCVIRHATGFGTGGVFFFVQTIAELEAPARLSITGSRSNPWPLASAVAAFPRQ